MHGWLDQALRTRDYIAQKQIQPTKKSDPIEKKNKIRIRPDCIFCCLNSLKLLMKVVHDRIRTIDPWTDYVQKEMDPDPQVLSRRGSGLTMND